MTQARFVMVKDMNSLIQTYVLVMIVTISGDGCQPQLVSPASQGRTGTVPVQ